MLEALGVAETEPEREGEGVADGERDCGVREGEELPVLEALCEREAAGEGDAEGEREAEGLSEGVPEPPVGEREGVGEGRAEGEARAEGEGERDAADTVAVGEGE